MSGADRIATADLEALLARATPGPWVRWAEHDLVLAGPLTRNDDAIATGARGAIFQAEERDEDAAWAEEMEEAGERAICGPMQEANADLGALAPALAAEVLELRKLVAAAGSGR